MQNGMETYDFLKNFFFRCFHRNLGSVMQPCVTSHILYIQNALFIEFERLSGRNGYDNHHLYASKMMLQLIYVSWKCVVGK